MPFVPHGRKGKQRRAAESKREADERVIEKVVGRAQFAVRHAPGRCLPLCVLVQRVLSLALPAARYQLRLGALKVVPRGLADAIAFDPRREDGTTPNPGILPPDEAFHAWLETPTGGLLDPSIFLTLHAKGYRVDRESYVLAEGREFEQHDLAFVYEELRELELVGLAESEAYLDRAISFVQSGHPLDLGPNFLDATWRTT
jgi:hypothetical protein